MSAIIIALINKKGGVGKTSTCHHLAGTLARHGRRVLLLDADPQASLTQGFWGPEAMRAFPGNQRRRPVRPRAPSRSPRPLIRPTAFEGIDCPRFGPPDRLQQLPRDRWGPSQGGMREFLDEGRDGFDLALIDCPPNLHLCSWAALVAADAVVVPLQAEDYGAQGIVSVQEAVAAVRADPNPSLRLLGYLLTMFDKRLGIHPAYERQLRELYGPTSSQLPSRWPRTSRRPWRPGCRSATTSRSRPPAKATRRSPTSCCARADGPGRAKADPARRVA